MIDSIWFWLYLSVGAVLCVTYTVALLLSGRRYDIEGHELEIGLVYLAMVLFLLFLWPSVVLAVIAVTVIGSAKK